MSNNDRYPLSPQRGRYFIRNRWINLLFRIIDAVLLGATMLSSRAASARPIHRILIANGAHLGDVLLSTAVLPLIKDAYPNVRIGMLVGSWSKQVVQNHELLDWVHTQDNWLLNRSALPIKKKILLWWRSRRSALREIREVGYDVAVDLYCYFPNSISLFWQAGIPERIGYTSAGLGPLLTRSLDIDMYSNRRSMVELYTKLLEQIPGIGTLRSDLAVANISRGVFNLEAVVNNPNYVVLHMGTGDPHREWPETSWITLAQQLLSKGNCLVLTGSGVRDKEKIERLKREIPEAIDLGNSLTWSEFVEVIAQAQLLISGNTVAPHIALAVSTPTIIVNHGINNPYLWHKRSQYCIPIMHQVSCAPCYRTAGCSSMACLRELAPSVVLHNALRLLNLSQTQNYL